jgi:hypothetical protein
MLTFEFASRYFCFELGRMIRQLRKFLVCKSIYTGVRRDDGVLIPIRSKAYFDDKLRLPMGVEWSRHKRMRDSITVAPTKQSKCRVDVNQS